MKKEAIEIRQDGSELRNVLRTISRHEKAGNPVPVILFERKATLEKRLDGRRS